MLNTWMNMIFPYFYNLLKINNNNNNKAYFPKTNMYDDDDFLSFVMMKNENGVKVG